MKRIALLLGCDTVDISTRYDVDTWESFLQSNRGGAWENTEIMKLVDPSKTEVTSKLESIRSKYDYLLLIFAGHGGIKKENGNDEQIFAIRESYKETIYLKELLDLTPKELIIADTCSGYISEDTKAFLSYRHFAEASERQRYKEKYNQRIATIASGTSYLISSDIGQVAKDNDDNQGGVFTQKLLSYSKGSRASILDVKTAYDEVKKLMPSDQQPRLSNGRRMAEGSYPIAVNI